VAIAFRSAGTRLKTDVGVTGDLQNVPMPAGHVATDLLLMFVLTDDNVGPTNYPGWTFLGVGTPGPSTTSLLRPHLWVFYRIDTGSLGANAQINFSLNAYPNGFPYVLACILAYTGCDQTSPIGEWNLQGTTESAVTRAHPQLTTATASDWLMTVRAVSAGSPAATFTCSVGTDAERVDDNDGFPELSFGIYDSNTALAAGLQTQRSTTASRTASWGSVLASIALRPTSPNVSQAPVAQGSGAAYDATVHAVSGPWDACGVLPVYSFAIDWNGDGSLSTPGANLTSNPYVPVDITGWNGNNAAVTWSADLAPIRVPGSVKAVPNGSSASGGVNQSPHSTLNSITAGNSYTADGWVYVPGGWSDIQACVDWFDASDVFISSGLGTGIPAAAGTWVHLTQTFVAPSGAVRGSARIRHGSTPASSVVYYAWGILLLDPVAPGTYIAPGPGEDVTSDILSDGVTIEYGRDQSRQLSPPKIGNSSFSLDNTARVYSPENATSPLAGDLDPARPMAGAVLFNGTVYPMGTGRIDDYDLHADYTNRTVSFTFMDGLKSLDGVTLSTEVVRSQRTGDLINYILDQAGWTGPRDIDPGATIVPYWWAEGVSAFSAVQDLVKSEGPPSIAYVSLDGTFVFRDRHHRLLRTQSVTAQAVFAQPELGECAPPAVTGLSFTPPFDYQHGWRDIVNSVTFTVTDRNPDAVLTAVWTSDDSVTLAIGETYSIEISASDPFVNAVAPVLGTDFTKTGLGTVQATISRTSGQTTTVMLLAVGGSVTVTGLQLRAQAIPVVRTTKVSRQDTGSISQHGERAYPDTAPWANVADSYAIAGTLLVHYSQRRPTIQLRVVAADGEHYRQILSRMISDRIHIVNGELGLDDDFFIEQVSHRIDRLNKPGQPPVHSVVFGCEKELFVTSNPFRFDVRGAGFDQGVFDPISSDDPATVFVFDDLVRGQFDVGTFGT